MVTLVHGTGQFAFDQHDAGAGKAFFVAPVGEFTRKSPPGLMVSFRLRGQALADELAARRPGSEARMTSMLAEVLLGESAVARTTPLSATRLADLEAWIEAHPGEPITLGRLVVVAGIATECGVFHLGRFAVGYRELFGESPSQALREAGRQRPGGAHPLPTGRRAPLPFRAAA